MSLAQVEGTPPAGRAGRAIRTVRRAPLVRSTLGLSVSRAVSGALLVCASVVVARAAGASALGVFGLAATVAIYAATIADAGVSAWVLVEVGRTERSAWPRIWGSVVRFELETALPFVVVYAAAVTFLTHGSIRLALLAAAPWWLLLRANGAARSVFTAAERVGAEGVATTVEAVVSLLAIALALTRTHSPAWAVLGLAAGAAAGLVIRLRGLGRLGLRGGPFPRGMLGAALPFAGFTILTMLYLRIDVVLLSLLSSARELGLYQPPVRFAVAALILPDAIATILLGRAARSPERTTVRRRQEQVLLVGVPVGIVLVVVCALFGRAILGALYGNEFREAWLALTLLAATVPVSFVAAVNGNTLTARGRQGTRLVCLAAASLVAVSAGVVAISAWGYTGAAAVSLANEIVLLGAYAIALARRDGARALVLPRLRAA